MTKKYLAIINFDSTPYLSSVNCNLHEGTTLAKQLRDLTPETATPAVLEAAVVVDEVIEECESAMVGRTRGDTSVIDAARVDYAVDGAWYFVVASLTRWNYLDREGLDLLDEDAELGEKVDVEAFRAKIEDAAELHEALFGGEGAVGLQRGFAEQAQWMANLLRLIQEDGHDEKLGPVVTEEVVPVLLACQRAYDRMVKARLQQPVDMANLRELRSALQRVITMYSSAVVGMITSQGAEAIPVIETALHPIIALREQKAQAARKGAAAVVAELDGSAQDAPEPEEQAPGEPLDQPETP